MNTEIKSFINANLEKTVRYSPLDDGTLIGLPYKYTVPCAGETFQELYYWDTYFTNLGLIVLGKSELAKSNVDNMLFLVEKYGFMPNGSRTHYLNRSQPPFLSEMVKDVFEQTDDKQWLSSAYDTLKKEYAFWQNKRLSENGLNGYFGYETDENKLDSNYAYFLSRTGFKAEREPDEALKREIYQATISVCESGWDCNSRVLAEGHYYNWVDLNSLLFGMEENMRRFSEILENGEAEIWQQRKCERRSKMSLLWNDKEGLFLDYNFKTNEFSDYKSAASFFPLYTGVATEEQAKRTVLLLDSIELRCGISCGEPDSQWSCQWDYPNVWAPIQLVVYKGLMNYGYTEAAERIARKYIGLIESGFEKTGNFWEKYNGNTGEVAANEYDAPPMMGWTCGVYLYFCNELGEY